MAELTELAINPFDLMLEQFRAIVREEMKAAGNGSSQAKLLMAEELVETFQVNKATVYEWVKSKPIPHYQAGLAPNRYSDCDLYGRNDQGNIGASMAGHKP